jgi:hypothetical protein
MAFLADSVFDSGLSVLDTGADRCDICSTTPTTYAQVASYTLGYNSALSVTSVNDRTGGGREVIVAAIASGTVTTAGTASCFALTYGGSLLRAVGSLNAPVTVALGIPWSLTSFTIGIPDPA